MRKVEQNGSTSAANIPTTTTNCETSSEHRTLDASGGAMPFVRLYPDIAKDLGVDGALLLDMLVQKFNWKKTKYFVCNNEWVEQRLFWSRNKVGREFDSLKLHGLIDYDCKVFGQRRVSFRTTINKYYHISKLDGRMHRNGANETSETTRNELNNNNLSDAMHQNGAPHQQQNTDILLENNQLNNTMHQNSAPQNNNDENSSTVHQNSASVHQIGASIIKEKKRKKKKEYIVQNQVLDGERDFEFSDSPESGNASHHCETNADPNPTPNCAAPLPTSSLNVPSEWWDALRLTDDQRTRILWEWEHLDCNIRKPSSELFKFFYIVYSALYRRANYRSYEKIVEASKQITDETQFVQSFIQQHTDGTIKIQSMLDYIASTTHKPNASTKPKASGARKKSSNNYDDNKLFVDFWERYPRTRGTKKADAFKAFNNMDAAAQQMCVDTLPECVSMYADREEQFIPHPSSYINGKVFETLNDPQHNPTKQKESNQTLTTYKAYDPNEKPEI